MIVAVGFVLVATNLTQHLLLALIAAICIGVAIGVFNGWLVAKIGIPSFIATLALFLAWQGIIQFALKGQPVNTSNYNLWHNLTYGNLTVSGAGSSRSSWSGSTWRTPCTPRCGPRPPA